MCCLANKIKSTGDEYYQFDPKIISVNNSPHVPGNLLREPPTSNSSDEELKKIFNRRISTDTNKKDLELCFSKFGDVTEVNVKRAVASRRPRSFTFASLQSKVSVKFVLQSGFYQINGKQIENQNGNACNNEK